MGGKKEPRRDFWDGFKEREKSPSPASGGERIRSPLKEKIFLRREGRGALPITFSAQERNIETGRGRIGAWHTLLPSKVRGKKKAEIFKGVDSKGERSRSLQGRG